MPKVLPAPHRRCLGRKDLQAPKVLLDRRETPVRRRRCLDRRETPALRVRRDRLV